MTQKPDLPTTFDGWVEFFEAGRRMTVPVSPSLLRRRIRGNRWVTALAAGGMALVLTGFIWLLGTDIGRTFTYIITGVLLVLSGSALVYLRRLRRRLAIAEIDPNHLEISRDGIVVAGTLGLAWENTVGVVSADLRNDPLHQPHRLGSRLAHAAGATRAEVMIGLAKGTAKAFKADADPRLRILIDAFSDCGSVRIPLDAVLHPSHVTSVLFAVCGAANVAGRESVLSHELPKIRGAVNKVMRSVPPITGLTVSEELERIANTAAGPAPAAPETETPAEPDPATPSEPTTPTLADLAGLVLSEEGRREHAAAANHLATEGPDSFFERYPHYDDGFSDDGPEPVDLLLAVGTEAATVGTCEARYEDSPGHVQHQVQRACERLGLPSPSFEGIQVNDGGDAVSARLREADEALRRVGLRLLFVDPDSDMYYFSPVTAEQFARFVDTSGEGFDLRGVDWIS